MIKGHIETVKDIGVCKNLWNKYSPNKSLYDLWDFRYLFFEKYKYQPFFIHYICTKRKSGLLPLWFNSYEKVYTWFGSNWMEDNTFFSDDGEIIRQLLKNAPRPLELCAIIENENTKLGDNMNIIDDDPKYVIGLNGLKSFYDYLPHLKKKKRYNLTRDYKHTNNLKPRLIINKFDDYKYLISTYNERLINRNEEISYTETKRSEIFFDMIKRRKELSFELRFISIHINNIFAAGDLVVIYKKVYYVLKGANNVKEYPGIGNYVNLIEINDAIELGMNKMDFMQEDCGWKEGFLRKEKLYKIDSRIT